MTNRRETNEIIIKCNNQMNWIEDKIGVNLLKRWFKLWNKKKLNKSRVDFDT